MTPLGSTAPPQADVARWHPLPRAARRAFMFSGALTGVPLALLGRVVDSVLRLPGHWIWMAGFALLGAVSGAVWGARRWRYTFWLLEDSHLALRRGRLWQSEVQVPINRVQHLDLLRGPLDRRYGLASLVIHTAGSRHNTVTIDGLALADAERLRNRLADQAGIGAARVAASTAAESDASTTTSPVDDGKHGDAHAYDRR